MSAAKAKELVIKAAIAWTKAINGHPSDLKKITDAQNALVKAVAALEKTASSTKALYGESMSVGSPGQGRP